MVEIFLKFLDNKKEDINAYRGGGYINKIIIDDSLNAFKKGFKIIEDEFLDSIDYECFQYHHIPKDFIDYYCQRFMIDRIEDIGFSYKESTTKFYQNDKKLCFYFHCDEKSEVFYNVFSEYLEENFPEKFSIKYSPSINLLWCSIEFPEYTSPCLFDEDFIKKYAVEKPKKKSENIKINDRSYIIELFCEECEIYTNRLPYD